MRVIQKTAQREAWSHLGLWGCGAVGVERFSHTYSYVFLDIPTINPTVTGVMFTNLAIPNWGTLWSWVGMFFGKTWDKNELQKKIRTWSDRCSGKNSWGIEWFEPSSLVSCGRGCWWSWSCGFARPWAIFELQKSQTQLAPQTMILGEYSKFRSIFSLLLMSWFLMSRLAMSDFCWWDP